MPTKTPLLLAACVAALPVVALAQEPPVADSSGSEPSTINLGIGFSPLSGLSLRADAWSMQIDPDAHKRIASSIPTLPGTDSTTLGIAPITSLSGANGLEDPLLGGSGIDGIIDGIGVGSMSTLSTNNRERKGIDLGASYMWETRRFGQFTLSTRATYVDYAEAAAQYDLNASIGDLANGGVAVDLDTLRSRAPLNPLASATEPSPERVLGPEVLGSEILEPQLQSSLTLSWRLGNHSASAVTRHIDSAFSPKGDLDDLNNLNMEAINELVDDVTTVDLQYGYTINTGANDRAIISFGIKNIFDAKTAQILNTSTLILDQNGRVAYGSIKYQF